MPAGQHEMDTISEPTFDNIEVKHTTWLDPDGVKLRGLLREEFLTIFSSEPGPDLSPGEVPVFIVVKLNTAPVACGALKTVQDDQNRAVEIKRMYVIPECRGRIRGIADTLMKELEHQAAERGWTTIQLETGGDMLYARKFYERHGYKQNPPSGYYVGSAWTVRYEKAI